MGQQICLGSNEHPHRHQQWWSQMQWHEPVQDRVLLHLVHDEESQSWGAWTHCKWVMDFLTGKCMCSTITLNTGVPQRREPLVTSSSTSVFRSQKNLTSPRTWGSWGGLGSLLWWEHHDISWLSSFKNGYGQDCESLTTKCSTDCRKWSKQHSTVLDGPCPPCRKFAQGAAGPGHSRSLNTFLTPLIICFFSWIWPYS